MSKCKVFVRSAFNYDRDIVSRETGSSVVGESMTKQSFKSEADINTIVRRFCVTGVAPGSVVPPTYSIFEDVFDFHSAMNAVAAARESFEAMPATIRSGFDNDPQRFVEFCSNPDNLDAMRKMGLAIPLPKEDNVSGGKDFPKPHEGNIDDRKSRNAARSSRRKASSEGSTGDSGGEPEDP